MLATIFREGWQVTLPYQNASSPPLRPHCSVFPPFRGGILQERTEKNPSDGE